MELSEHELDIFCRVAKVIVRKGHLEIGAILKFIGSKDYKEDKKIIEKLYRLQLLQKHRSNTYELTKIGRWLAMDKCEWFKERHSH